MILASFHLEGAMLHSPPMSEDVLTMIATGWDWVTLQDTPQRVVDEIMLYRGIESQYMAERNKQ